MTPTETKYIPQIGDSVDATRIEKSRIYENRIVGPVTQIWDNACLVAFRFGSHNDIVEHRLYFSDWNFRFLHKTEEPTP